MVNQARSELLETGLQNARSTREMSEPLCRFVSNVWAEGMLSSEQAPLGNGPPRELHPEIGQRVTPLIAQLGAPRFVQRERAHEALLGLGTDAIPYLREGLNGQLSVEARRRLEGVHRQLIAQNGGVEFNRFGQVTAVNDLVSATYLPGIREVITATVTLPGRDGNEAMRLFFRRRLDGTYEQHQVAGTGQMTRLDDIANVTIDAQGNCMMQIDDRFSVRLSRNGQIEYTRIR